MMQPGDVLLFRGHSLFDRAIRFGQAQRPSLKPFSRFTHAGVSVGPALIAEATSRGVRINALDPTADYVVAHLDATPEQRRKIIAVCRKRVGTEYGGLEIIDIGLRLVGLRGLPFVDHDALICSELVAVALKAAGLWDAPTYDVTPADLAAHFQIAA